MKFLVIDAGYKQGKDRNILFATNNKRKAITVAGEVGQGVSVIEKTERDESEKIIFISDYKATIELSE
jgi:hypothetical protein